MDLVVNGVEHVNLWSEAVNEILKHAEGINDLETWFSHTDRSSITALLNARRGWLMFSNSETDKCWRTQNSSITSNDEDSYLLSNGQKDFYPNSYAYSRKSIFAALNNFISSGQLDPSLSWVDGMV